MKQCPTCFSDAEPDATSCTGCGQRFLTGPPTELASAPRGGNGGKGSLIPAKSSMPPPRKRGLFGTLLSWFGLGK